jgi:hypothetical protein
MGTRDGTSGSAVSYTDVVSYVFSILVSHAH